VAAAAFTGAVEGGRAAVLVVPVGPERAADGAADRAVGLAGLPAVGVIVLERDGADFFSAAFGLRSVVVAGFAGARAPPVVLPASDARLAAPVIPLVSSPELMIDLATVVSSAELPNETLDR
jgi:hypothetical protein